MRPVVPVLLIAANVGLAAATAGANHLVQGLTYGQARMAYTLRSVSPSDAAGAVCVVPSMQVTVGLSDLTVYLARERVPPCRRAMVEAHEQEHVAHWRRRKVVCASRSMQC